MNVVGTMFFKDKRLLIDKPRKRPTYQMIGGRVEEGKTPIHFYVFKYNDLLDGKLNKSEEIENFKWYKSSDDIGILSNTLKNEVVPYCINNNLIK